GPNASHGTVHEFNVVVRDIDHPVMDGMPREWKHMKDELYHGQRGPAGDMHILATAYSDKSTNGTGKVIIVAPGGIQTEMFRKNTFPVAPLVGTAYEGPFRKLNSLVKHMEKESASPEEVARFLVRVFEARTPKARYAHSRAFMDGPWTILIPDL